MKVSAIGLGYIGLPTAAIFASRKIQVVGVDVNEHIVNTINKGEIHIVEPELDLIVHDTVKSGYLRATLKPETADVFLIAVPTPFKDNHEPDLSYIESAVKLIAPVIEKGNMVILESTSPVGATEKMAQWMSEKRSDLKFPVYSTDDASENNSDVNIAHCPERVLPGNITKELISNDRIIGGITLECANKAKDFYELVVEGKCLVTDARTAELSKLVENSYRDVNIAFANELSLISDKLDVNVWELIRLANHHPRVNILQPGPGVGGHCIAVDPWFIVNSAPDESKLIKTAREVNDSKPGFVLSKVNEAAIAIGHDKSSLSVACLGLAFKPDIDDVRESPAFAITKEISKMGFKHQYIVEPNLENMPADLLSCDSTFTDVLTAIKSSDVIVLLVDHTPFQEIDTNLLLDKKVVDTRGFWRGDL